MDDDVLDDLQTMDEALETGEEYVTPTQMPTFKQEEYLAEHQHTDRVDEAHPITDTIIDMLDVKMVGTLPFALAAVQAIADTAESFEDEFSATRRLQETEEKIYYQVASQTYYQLCVKAYEQYESEYTKVEQLANVMEVHTHQLLADLHNYEGDFDGHNPTLCNAYNHDSPQDGAVTSQEEPENGHYGFVDSRGFILIKNTHTQSL